MAQRIGQVHAVGIGVRSEDGVDIGERGVALIRDRRNQRVPPSHATPHLPIHLIPRKITIPIPTPRQRRAVHRHVRRRLQHHIHRRLLDTHIVEIPTPAEPIVIRVVVVGITIVVHYEFDPYRGRSIRRQIQLNLCPIPLRLAVRRQLNPGTPMAVIRRDVHPPPIHLVVVAPRRIVERIPMPERQLRMIRTAQIHRPRKDQLRPALTPVVVVVPIRTVRWTVVPARTLRHLVRSTPTAPHNAPRGGDPVAVSAVEVLVERVGDRHRRLIDRHIVDVPPVAVRTSIRLHTEPNVHPCIAGIAAQVDLGLTPLRLVPCHHVELAAPTAPVRRHLNIPVVVVRLETVPLPETKHRHTCMPQVDDQPEGTVGVVAVVPQRTVRPARVPTMGRGVRQRPKPVLLPEDGPLLHVVREGVGDDPVPCVRGRAVHVARIVGIVIVYGVHPIIVLRGRRKAGVRKRGIRERIDHGDEGAAQIYAPRSAPVDLIGLEEIPGVLRPGEVHLVLVRRCLGNRRIQRHRGRQIRHRDVVEIPAVRSAGSVRNEAESDPDPNAVRINTQLNPGPWPDRDIRVGCQGTPRSALVHRHLHNRAVARCNIQAVPERQLRLRRLREAQIVRQRQYRLYIVPVLLARAVGPDLVAAVRLVRRNQRPSIVRIQDPVVPARLQVVVERIGELEQRDALFLIAGDRIDAEITDYIYTVVVGCFGGEPGVGERSVRPIRHGRDEVVRPRYAGRTASVDLIARERNVRVLTPRRLQARRGGVRDRRQSHRRGAIPDRDIVYVPAISRSGGIRHQMESKEHALPRVGTQIDLLHHPGPDDLGLPGILSFPAGLLYTHQRNARIRRARRARVRREGIPRGASARRDLDVSEVEPGLQLVGVPETELRIGSAGQVQGGRQRQ